MADGDELAGCIGGLFMMALFVAAVIAAVMVLMSLGTLFGAGTAIKNYYLAFANNVKPERAAA